MKNLSKEMSIKLITDGKKLKEIKCAKCNHTFFIQEKIMEDRIRLFNKFVCLKCGFKKIEADYKRRSLKVS